MPLWMPENNVILSGDDEMRAAAKLLQILYNASGYRPSPFPEGLAPFPGDDLQRLYQKIRYATSSGVAAGGGSEGGDGEAELLNILTNYWTLNEASGTRFPCYGALNFSESGTVGSITGKDGDAADFGDGETLVTASFSLPLPYSIAFWVFIPNSADEEGVQVLTHGSERICFIGSPLDGTVDYSAQFTGGVKNVTTSPITFDAWNLIVVTVDSSGVIKGSTNGEALITGDTVTINPGAGVMRIGRNGSPLPAFAMDSVFIFNQALSQSQVDLLWNNGDGFFPPCEN